MSATTKAFVVLHVILSMLLTAGVVVFVNRVENYKTIVANEQANVAIANRAAAAAEANASSIKEALTAAQGQLTSQANAAQEERRKAAADLAAKNTEIANLEKQLAIVNTQNTQLTAATSAAQTAQNQLNTQLAEVRATVDDLQKKKLDLDTAIADLTHQRDTLEKQRRDLAERLAAVDADFQRAVTVMNKNNIKFGPDISPDWTSPRINGVIREVRMIEQVRYATISVGSADSVTKGMKFRVTDRKTGEFLGYLTVESVEAQEASGRLDGPAIDRVAKNNDVRTQL